MGLEAPSQVVPPGSWQALSTGPNVPSTGFGENILGDVAQSVAVRLPDLATIVASFVPALQLDDQPELTQRLLELATRARGPQQVTITGTPQFDFHRRRGVAAIKHKLAA